MGSFSKATKSAAKLRLGISGPAGGGKSYSALAIGTALLKPGQRMAVIDTERGSAAKYANLFDFDTAEIIGDYHPDTYVKMLREADAAGYGVIVVDSLSHAWNGPGGILEIVDKSAKSGGRGGGNWDGWKIATPIQNRMINALLSLNAHVICTMRSKVEWDLQKNDQGKMAPKKIGTAPVQREALDFEFDVFGDIDVDHNLVINKSRCPELAGQSFNKPGAEVSRILTRWLEDGAPVPLKPKDDVPDAKTMSKVAAMKLRLVEVQSWDDFDAAMADVVRTFDDTEKAEIKPAFTQRWTYLANKLGPPSKKMEPAKSKAAHVLLEEQLKEASATGDITQVVAFQRTLAQAHTDKKIDDETLRSLQAKSEEHITAIQQAGVKAVDEIPFGAGA